MVILFFCFHNHLGRQPSYQYAMLQVCGQIGGSYFTMKIILIYGQLSLMESVGDNIGDQVDHR